MNLLRTREIVRVSPAICLLAFSVCAYGGDAVAAYSKLPLAFEENAGQTDARVKYLAHGLGYTVYLTPTEAVLSMSATSIRLKIIGGTSDGKVQGVDPLPGKINYFRGTDRTKWRSNIDTYEKVRYKNVYRGVDLVYYGKQGQLEFDFVAAPGADVAAIRFRLDGAQPRIDSAGNLVLKVGTETMRVQKPLLYQNYGVSKQVVDGRFRITRDHEIGFSVNQYDRSRTLVIDPTLIYGTYLGGSAQTGSSAKDTYLLGMAVGPSGEAYVTGYTFVSNFPTTSGVLQPAEPQCKPGDCSGPLTGPDAFVSRISADGSRLIYSTYLGGNNQDVGTGIALDANGNAYVTGYTFSNDFPLVAPIQTLCSPIGVFSFATNTFTSLGHGCEAHPAGESNVYSANTPDAFISELSQSGSLLFSTFFGGSANESPVGIGLDSQGNIYIGGSTSSIYQPNTPSASTIYPPGGMVPLPVTASAFESSAMTGNNGNYFVGFVAKFSGSTHQLLYSSVIGPSVNAQTFATSMSVGPNGRVVLGGYTNSVAFPTRNAFQPTCPPYSGGPQNCNISGFVAVFDTTQSGPASVVYSTYLNGTLPDQAQTKVSGVATDALNNVYVTGTTSSNNLPATSGAYSQTCVGGGPGFCNGSFVTKLAPTGTLSWLSYFGCTVNVPVNSSAITTDSSSNVYFAGNTTCQLPLVGALQSVFTGNAPTFVAALSSDGSSLIFDSYFAGSGNDNPTVVRIDPGNNVYVAGYSTATDLPVTTGVLQGSVPAPGYRNGFVAKITPINPVGQIAPSGVVNGASFQSGPVSPGLIVTVFGLNLGPQTLAGAQLDASGRLATTIAGTRLLFDGKPAPLIYVSSGQIGAIAPYAIASQTSTQVQVEYQGVKTTAVTLPVAAANPALFTADSSGKGPGAILNQDTSLNSSANPAPKNSVVVLFATGEGQTDPPGTDGQIANTVLPKPTQMVSVLIGGIQAEVIYAGAAGGLTAGALQVNVRIPLNAPSGPLPVSLIVGGTASPGGVTVAVQ